MVQLVRIVYVRHAVILNICSVAVVAVCVVFLLLSPRPASGVWQQRMLRIFFSFSLLSARSVQLLVRCVRVCICAFWMRMHACGVPFARSLSLSVSLTLYLYTHTCQASTHARMEYVPLQAAAAAVAPCVYTRRSKRAHTNVHHTFG